MSAGYRLAMAFHPLLIGCVLYTFSIFPVLLLRKLTQGYAYNHSYSSWLGDAALSVFIGLMANEIKNSEKTIPLVNSTSYQTFCFIFAITTSVFMTISGGFGYPADIYHNTVVVFIFVFLVLSFMPMLIIGKAHLSAKIGTFCLILWFVTMVVDFVTHRLDQSQWRLDRNLPI